MFSISQYLSEKKIVRFNLENWLNGATVAVRTDSVISGFTFTVSYSSPNMDFTLSGGTAGQSYLVSSLVQASDGRKRLFFGTVAVLADPP